MWTLKTGLRGQASVSCAGALQKFKYKRFMKKGKMTYNYVTVIYTLRLLFFVFVLEFLNSQAGTLLHQSCQGCHLGF